MRRFIFNCTLTEKLIHPTEVLVGNVLSHQPPIMRLLTEMKTAPVPGAVWRLTKAKRPESKTLGSTAYQWQPPKG